MEVNSSAAMRKRATDWLNSKDRDLDTGIKVLEDASYKPAVMDNFRKNFNRRDIPPKLLLEIRNYLRYYASPYSDIHRDVVIDPETYEIVKQIGQDSTNEYPAEVKQVIAELSDVYKSRGVFHNQLAAIGEGNTNEQKAERRKLIAIIKACSDRIAVLSESYQKFKTDGLIPSPEVLSQVFDADKVVVPPAPEDQKPEKDEKEFVLASTLEDMKKQSENWRTKLAKAENKLLYQVEKKLPKPNPIPAGPKRIKQEKRIAQLKAEKEQIDLAVVNWA